MQEDRLIDKVPAVPASKTCVWMRYVLKANGSWCYMQLVSRSHGVARSLGQQLTGEGGNPCHGQASPAVAEYLFSVSLTCFVIDSSCTCCQWALSLIIDGQLALPFN